MPQNRVAIFIDGANLFYAQREMGWRIDLEKFLNYVEDNFGHVVDAYYYQCKEADQSEKKQQFLDLIVNYGYALVSKDVKVIHGYDDNIIQKANLDVEIVLDMFNTINSYDIAILVSGDSDFERALQQVRARGKEFYVFSTGCCVAREIRQLAGKRYINFETLRSELLHKELLPPPWY